MKKLALLFLLSAAFLNHAKADESILTLSNKSITKVTINRTSTLCGVSVGTCFQVNIYTPFGKFVDLEASSEEGIRFAEYVQEVKNGSIDSETIALDGNNRICSYAGLDVIYNSKQMITDWRKTNILKKCPQDLNP